MAEMVWHVEFSPDGLGDLELAALKPLFPELIREVLQDFQEEQEPE